MLTITVNEDQSITVTSDDANAENFGVAEALDNAGYADLVSQWNDTPMSGDELSATFAAGDDTRRVLDAIEEDPSLGADDQVTAANLKLTNEDEHVGGGPPPSRA